MITISEEEYLRVVEGMASFNNITIRKLKETEDALKAARELKEEYVKMFNNAEKKIAEQSKQLDLWRRSYEAAKALLTKKQETILHTKFAKEFENFQKQ